MTAHTTIIQPASVLQSAPHSALRRLVIRHPAMAFLSMAFAFAWTTMLPLLLSERGFGVLPIELPVTVFQMLAAVLGLTLPAFLVSAATGGKAGLRDLLHRAMRWRVGVQWYFVALLGTFVAVMIVVVPFLGMAPLEEFGRKWHLLFTVFLPSVLLPMLHTNLPEEIGWTSLQSRLQDRRGPVLASIMVAPAFALIHLPAYFVAGWINDEKTPLPEALLTVGAIAVLAIFFRLLIMWLYNGSGRSILIVALFHSAFNMITGQKITPEFLPGPDATVLNLLPWALIAVLAVVIVAVTRGRLSYSRVPD